MRSLLFISAFLLSWTCKAQNLEYAQKIIQKLCSEDFKGRGYVGNGVNKSATFLVSEFENLKLKKFNNSYIQTYSFPVNTFPNPILCKVDNVTKKEGIDFFVSADATQINGKYNLRYFNTKDSLDIDLLRKKNQKWI